MSLISADVQTPDGVAVTIFVYYCDGCGKVVRGKKWRGRCRLAINPPPKGWTETMVNSGDGGIRLAWCRPECEKPAYTMKPEERQAMFAARQKFVEKAHKRLMRKILGIEPWEKAPWEKGYGK